MDLLKSLKIAAAGLRAQNGRMRVIAENLANANSTAEAKGAEPYRRKVPSFAQIYDSQSGATLVSMNRVEFDRKPFPERHDPGHPAANDNGYVSLPNVDPLIESMDMREAQRTYEANVNVIGATRGMLSRTLDILRA
jgi:flagellar basal-body rod protein FlgC